MIYGLGDLHLDYTKKKKMCVFGDKWLNHEERIFTSWREIVKDRDLVLLPGDISWALRLEEAYHDLIRIEELPGRKIIIKGNHDYWWEGPKKLRNLGFKTIDFIQNNAYEFNDIGIYGTRAWSPIDTDGFTDKDRKIFDRELNRLRLSLDHIKNKEKKIVMLHYPPFNMDGSPNEFVDIMKDYDVDICIYGHLHAEGHRFIVEGEIQGIDFYCMSSDYVDFKPKEIEI